MDVSAPSFISPDIVAGSYLFLELEASRGSRLAPVCAGLERCAPHYRIARAGFDYHAVELVVGGSWKLRHEGCCEILHPGAVFAYGPDTDYSLEPEQGRELIKYFVTFTGDGAAGGVEGCGLGGCRVLYARQLRWLQDLFDQLIDCNRLDPAASRELATRLTELILMRVGHDTRPGDEGVSEARRSFERCHATIRDGYLEIRSVAELARRCHLDPAYLARLFQRFSAERPLQLLTRLKTQHAADLIVRRGFSVKAAGEAVGFPDPYHFSRVFKRVHGVSPGRIPRH